MFLTICIVMNPSSLAAVCGVSRNTAKVAACPWRELDAFSKVQGEASV
jgi:hypothetical protein